MEIIPEIISNEKVRPSSPTPHHLKTYQRSMLDQMMLPVLIPVVLYLPPNNSVTTFETTEILKRSLASILTRFYPLAGRLRDDVASIDCNDEGVPFVVAEIKGHKLSDLLQRNDNQLHSNRLFPCEVTVDGEMGPNDSVLMIQLNYFDCGGIVIAAVFCHAVADAMTLANFLNSWAETTRLTDAVVCPNYIAQSLFPHKDEIKNESNPSRGVYKIGKSIMRRFVFDSSAISKLKDDIVKSSSHEGVPTRVEAVSALMWKCFMAASLANDNSKSMVVQAVNLRRRAQPRLSQDCFGNLVGLAPATTSNNSEMGLDVLVRKMRESIKKIDRDYVNRMQGDKGLLGYTENQGLTFNHDECVDILSITSWCGFDFYRIDFGWGKPIWVGGCHTAYVNDDSESGFVNEVALMDTKNGDGIEAWVALDAKYMPIFENVEHLRALASVNPIPGNI